LAIECRWRRKFETGCRSGESESGAVNAPAHRALPKLKLKLSNYYLKRSAHA
jgi:hypothetical protein